MRRIVTLLLGLLTLHLTTVGNSPVCATTDTHSAHRAMPNGSAHSGAGHEAERPVPSPNATDCCRALASCAACIALGSEARVRDDVPVRQLAFGDVSSALVGRVDSPDPPPPKS